VSFSGGRDSSAVLALAAHVARRHGLPLPVPVIKRYPRAPRSDESVWQQLVLDHLDLKAEILTFADELDLLGDAARATLIRHGVRWPANGYLHVPIFAVARGGSLLTGIGGDELLATTAARHVLLLHRTGGRPALRDARSLVPWLLPRPVRARLWRRHHAPYPWLRPPAREAVRAALARDEAEAPARWDRALQHWQRTRSFVAMQRALPLLARDDDVHVLNPLLDPGVLGTLLRSAGPTGFPDRTTAMRGLVGDLLPDPLLARETKATFGEAVWGPRARAFAQDWAGEGLDASMVDVDALRSTWLAAEPDMRTAMLLQRAWLAAPDTGG
jgi:asparagine synthase (glutamine-hydrolysing)